MNPNDAIIAQTYIAQCAARTDAYAKFVGTAVEGQWVCVREPLTAEVVIAAFSGGPSISGYTITPQNVTHVCCIDFDDEDAFAAALRFRDAAAVHGITAYPEPSRRGGHVWMFLDVPAPAKTVRRAMRKLLAEAGIPESPKVELRPAQDEIKPDGFGSPIRMPTMPHPKTGRRYPLIGPDDAPLSTRLSELLIAIEWSPRAAFEDLAMRFVPPMKELPSDFFPPRCIRPDEEVESISAVLMELYGAQRVNPGHATKCPFHDDRNPSLSVASDDQRVWCKSPACWAWNDGRGRGPAEVRRHFAGLT